MKLITGFLPLQFQGIDIDQCLLWALGLCILTAFGYLSMVDHDIFDHTSMTTSVHRSLSDDSNSSFNKNIWVLGVCLIIIGSLGNNLGNNLVSLDHKQKQAEQAEAERQKREEAKEQSASVDLEQGKMTPGTTTGSDKGGNSSVTHPQSIKCEKGHDVHKIVGKHIPHDSLEKGHTHPETQHMCTICNLKELEREVDGWYRCHVCDHNKCAKCALETNSAKETTKTNGSQSSPPVTATSVEATDRTHTPNGEVVVGKPEKKNKTCSYRTIGTTIFVIGNLATFASFGFAAQSLLASLESIQFVSNIFFVRFVHKEVVTYKMILATLSIVVGNVLVVIFSDHSPALMTSDMLLQLYATNEAYWIYLGIALLLWAINHFTYAHYYHVRVKKAKLLWQHGFIEPFTFAVSSAIIGTQAVLQSKCMSMLIQVSSRGIVNEFTRPHIWWILVTWIILVAYWLRRLDKGLELFPPLFIIPVLQVFFVFFAIMCGGVYFEEFIGFTYQQYIGFVFGVIMILGGVFGLAPNDLQIIAPPQKEEEEAAILEKPVVDETGIGMIDKENKDKPGSNSNLKNVSSNNDSSAQNEKDKAEKLSLNTSPDNGLGGFKTTPSNVTLESVPPSMNSSIKLDSRPLLASQPPSLSLPAAATKTPPSTTSHQQQIPQLTLGMGERTRSGLTESPTTLDSPIRTKPAVSLPTTDSAGNKLHPVILSPEKRDTVLFGSPTSKATPNHEENDEHYFHKSTPKGNRRVVKRGTTSIERYADRNVTVRDNLPPLRVNVVGKEIKGNQATTNLEVHLG